MNSLNLSISNLRTLFITRSLPYPPMGGAPLRNWQNMNVMKKLGLVGVFSVFKGNAGETILPDIDYWRHSNVDQSLSAWEKLENKLWWLRPNAHPNTDNLYRRNTQRALKQVLAEFKPDIVIFEELWLYPYLREVERYGCRIILDEHNVEADIFQQNYGSPKLQFPRIKAIEKDFLHRVDQVWTCSQADISLLQTLYGQLPKTHAIANGIDIEHYRKVRLRQFPIPEQLEAKKPTVIFLGQYNYPPNRVAAQLLIEEIYPRLKNIYGDCRLLLVGKNPTPYMQKAAKQEPGIIVTGSIPDVRPYLATGGVMAVPLLQGGGTRLKILEAFAAGCPVVSTAKGAEGLNARDGEHLLIREEIEAIVEAIGQIWSEPSWGDKLAQAAYQLVAAEYSWEAAQEKVVQAIQKIS